MAYLPATMPKSKTTLTVNDYAAATVSILTLQLDSADVPISDDVDSGEVMVNGSTGKQRYSTPMFGLAGGQEHTIGLVATDPKNNTDVTSTLSLFRALALGSVAGTGFSGYTFTISHPPPGVPSCER